MTQQGNTVVLLWQKALPSPVCSTAVMVGTGERIRREAFNRHLAPGGAERRRLCSLVVPGNPAAVMKDLEKQGAQAGNTSCQGLW